MAGQCETVDSKGQQCRGYAYGDARQCYDCAARGVPPCPDYLFTVVANDHAEARALLAQKRAEFERYYPRVRMIPVGDDHDYRWTKSRKAHIGQRQHWQYYHLERAKE